MSEISEAQRLLCVQATRLKLRGGQVQSLRAIAEELRPLGRHAAFYLAAAVSDFYIPWPQMVRLLPPRISAEQREPPEVALAALAAHLSEYANHLFDDSFALKDVHGCSAWYSHVWSTGGAQDTVCRIWRGVPSGAAEGAI